MFEKVQQTRPEVHGADENLAAARSRLLTEIQREDTPARARARWRPGFVVAGVLGAAAAVTAGALVVGAITAPTPTPTAEAVPTRKPGPVLVPSPVPTPTPTPTPMTGPEVLMGAANAAAGFTPPALAPGQYLRRTWTEEWLVLYNPETELDRLPGYATTRSTASSAWVLSFGGADYAPAELRGQWYAERGPLSGGSVYGNEGEARAHQDEMVRTGSPGSPLAPSEAPRLPESGAEDVLWFFESLPRDPQEMIAWIYDYLGSDRPGWEDGKVGWFLIGLLSHNVGDPEMRASMYRALSLLPGSTVGAEQDGRRTIIFDAHLSVSDGAPTMQRRFTMTFEMATGIVTEVTDTTEAGEGVVPSGVPDFRTTFEMSVVDALP